MIDAKRWITQSHIALLQKRDCVEVNELLPSPFSLLK